MRRQVILNETCKNSAKYLKGLIDKGYLIV